MAVVCNTEGRRLLIEFTCGRCGAVEYAPYIDNPAHSATNNMTAAATPDGWTAASGYMPMLCPSCTAAYDEFMRVAKVREAKEVDLQCQHKSE